MDSLLATFNHMSEIAEMLNIKYGATVAVHYMRMQREKMQSDVLASLTDSYISSLCEQL